MDIKEYYVTLPDGYRIKVRDKEITDSQGRKITVQEVIED